MKQAGNVGNGDRPERHEPGRVALSPERFNAVAWHHGKRPSKPVPVAVDPISPEGK